MIQRSTGATAEGRIRLTYTGALQLWAVHVVSPPKATFTASAATAVALARTTAQGSPMDAHQWLVEFTLEDEEKAHH